MAQGNKLHGVSRAPFLDQEQIELLNLSDRDDRLLLAIHQASTEKLKFSYLKTLGRADDYRTWLISDALQSRGIAPCFYGVPVKREDWQDEDTDFITMVTDLSWIVSTYPNHEPEWKRLKALWKHDRFMDEANYLWWNGQRSAGQIVKALNLSEQQQRECAFIQSLNVERWRHRLFKRLPIAQNKIAAYVREKDRRTYAEQSETIKRRSDLWLCAELAKWKPQQTADFYAMMMGEVLPRNVVSSQLAKLPKVRRTDTV